MDGMNRTARDPFTTRRDAAGMTQMINALDELENTFREARPLPGTNRVLMLREPLLQLIGEIRTALPESVRTAAEIVRDEKSIRDKAKQDAEERTGKARAEAEKALNESAKEAEKNRQDSKSAAEEAARIRANANNAAASIKAQAESDAKVIQAQAQQQANALYAQAQQQCEAMIARARQEANMIIADAESKARSAALDEHVYHLAVMQANELREATEKEMAGMRQRYLNDLCAMMGEVDDYLVDLVNNVRRERAKLINQR